MKFDALLAGFPELEQSDNEFGAGAVLGARSEGVAEHKFDPARDGGRNVDFPRERGFGWRSGHRGSPEVGGIKGRFSDTKGALLFLQAFFFSTCKRR